MYTNPMRHTSWLAPVLLTAVLGALLGGCSGSGSQIRNDDDVRRVLTEDRQRIKEIERKIDMQSTRLNRFLAYNPELGGGGAGGGAMGGGGSYDTLLAYDVQFRVNSYDLSNSDRTLLDRVAEEMALTPASRLEIRGFTDSTGGRFYNHLLSEQRTGAAVRYLVGKYDIPLYRIHTIGFGEDMQSYIRDTASREDRNRRIEVRLLIARGAGYTGP